MAGPPRRCANARQRSLLVRGDQCRPPRWPSPSPCPLPWWSPWSPSRLRPSWSSLAAGLVALATVIVPVPAPVVVTAAIVVVAAALVVTVVTAPPAVVVVPVPVWPVLVALPVHNAAA